jgi:hypothetical protein
MQDAAKPTRAGYQRGLGKYESERIQRVPRCGRSLTPAARRRFIPGALAHHPIDRLAAAAKTAQFAVPADLQASFLIKVRF